MYFLTLKNGFHLSKQNIDRVEFRVDLNLVV